MDNKKFYAYVWSDEEGRPYYVGKGNGSRAYVSRLGEAPQPPSDLGRVELYPCDSEDLAFEMEVDLISRYGRRDLGTGCLENRSNGGEGRSKGRGGSEEEVAFCRKRHSRSDKFSKRVLMSKVPDVVVVEEDLYYVMQCAAKAALCRFINYGVESDELANELYVRWKETGLRPSHRRSTFKGKPTLPAKVPVIPMGKWELYHIFKSDFLDMLRKEGRRLRREELMPCTE